MLQLLESPIPHSKEFTWFPKDLPSSFAKEVYGDKVMFFHQLLSSWSVFAAMYAETVGCQLGSEPQSPRGTSVIFSDQDLADGSAQGQRLQGGTGGFICFRCGLYGLIISLAREGIATTRCYPRQVGAMNKAVLLTFGKVRCIYGGKCLPSASFLFLKHLVVK